MAKKKNKKKGKKKKAKAIEPAPVPGTTQFPLVPTLPPGKTWNTMEFDCTVDPREIFGESYTEFTLVLLQLAERYNIPQPFNEATIASMTDVEFQNLSFLYGLSLDDMRVLTTVRSCLTEYYGESKRPASNPPMTSINAVKPGRFACKSCTCSGFLPRDPDALKLPTKLPTDCTCGHSSTDHEVSEAVTDEMTASLALEALEHSLTHLGTKPGSLSEMELEAILDIVFENEGYADFARKAYLNKYELTPASAEHTFQMYDWMQKTWNLKASVVMAALRNNGIHTLGDLKRVTASDWQRWLGLTEEAAKEVYEHFRAELDSTFRLSDDNMEILEETKISNVPTFPQIDTPLSSTVEAPPISTTPEAPVHPIPDEDESFEHNSDHGFPPGLSLFDKAFILVDFSSLSDEEKAAARTLLQSQTPRARQFAEALVNTPNQKLNAALKYIFSQEKGAELLASVEEYRKQSNSSPEAKTAEVPPHSRLKDKIENNVRTHRLRRHTHSIIPGSVEELLVAAGVGPKLAKELSQKWAKEDHNPRVQTIKDLTSLSRDAIYNLFGDSRYSGVVFSFLDQHLMPGSLPEQLVPPSETHIPIADYEVLPDYALEPPQQPIITPDDKNISERQLFDWFRSVRVSTPKALKAAKAFIDEGIVSIDELNVEGGFTSTFPTDVFHLQVNDVGKIRTYFGGTNRLKGRVDEFVNAALAGNMRLLARLRCTVSINCKNQKWGLTALQAAAGNGHLSCVKYLCVCGANINVQEKGGWTPLMLAVRAGKADVVEYLVGIGADVTKRTKYKQTLYNFNSSPEVADALERGLAARAAYLSNNKDPKTKPVINWDEEDVTKWLKAQGFESYMEKFRGNMINGDMLLDVDLEDLTELGVTDEEHKQKLLDAIDQLRVGPVEGFAIP